LLNGVQTNLVLIPFNKQKAQQLLGFLFSVKTA